MHRFSALAAVLAVAVASSACEGGSDAGPAKAERSLLSLLADPPRSGTFEAEISNGPGKPRVVDSGRFWAVGDDVVTRLHPFRRDVVDREVDGLLKRIERDIASSKPDPDNDPERIFLLDRDYYRGRDFQYDLESVVVEAMGPLFVAVGPLAVRTGSPCAAAVERHRSKVRDAVDALKPSFRADTWTIETQRLGDATEKSRRTAIDSCGADEDGTTASEVCALRIERTETTITVSHEPECPPTATTGRHVMTLRAVPADVGSRPRDLDPVSAFEPVNRFLIRVSQCGTLPWAYSNVAAGDSYTPPDADDYSGPTPLVDNFWCEHEVREDRRREAREGP